MNDLQRELREFAAQREWQRFHTPKNLVMALAGEVGELVELFQWLTPGESAAVMTGPEQAERVREEVADVFSYLLQLADVLDIALGPDFVRRGDQWVGIPDQSKDPVMKDIDPADYTRLAANIYYVLASRGTRGCRLYSTDEETRNYLASLLTPPRWDPAQVR